jgi:hypothetical protein
MHPYRVLLLAVLATIVMAQVVAMVMVTRSQVQKAEAYYAHERAAMAAETAEKSATAAPASARDGAMKVGYVIYR